MNARFQPGELVDVHVKGARVVEAAAQYFVFETAQADAMSVYMDDPQVTVERIAPAEWPPQPGDLWEDRHGSTWFAFTPRIRHDSEAPVRMLPEDPTNPEPLTPDKVLEAVGPLALQRRKGWTPAPAADEPKPAEVDKRTATIAGLRALADLIEAQPTLPTPYVQANIYVEHLLKDPDEQHAELERIARVLDVEPDARDKETWPGQRHRYARKALGGGVSYEAVICNVYPDPAADVPPVAATPPPVAVTPGAAAGTVAEPAVAPQDGHAYACCGKVGRLSRHNPWCSPAPSGASAGEGGAGRLPGTTAPDFKLGPVPHERCYRQTERHQPHTVFDEHGTFDCPGRREPLTDEQIDGALVVLAGALDANPACEWGGCGAHLRAVLAPADDTEAGV